MARDIGTARDALQTRLGNLSDAVSYDVATGNENARMNKVILQVFPAPPIGTGGFWPGHAGDDCPIRYGFVVQAWSSTAGGLAKAQDRLDGFISPAGTHANSIENALEDPDGDYSGDALDTMASSVRVSPFQSYGFAALNSDTANALMATMQVEVLLPSA